ncbi:unnamed protein product, partial [Laminaria digitata]
CGGAVVDWLCEAMRSVCIDESIVVPSHTDDELRTQRLKGTWYSYSYHRTGVSYYSTRYQVPGTWYTSTRPEGGCVSLLPIQPYRLVGPFLLVMGGTVWQCGHSWPVPGISCARRRVRGAGKRYDIFVEFEVCCDP